MTSREPMSTDPTGAPSPLEKHIITVSATSAHSASGTPEAASAFHSRAPSRWTRAPPSRAARATSRRVASGTITPPFRLCVFSRHTSASRATCSSSDSNAARTVSAGITPSAARMGRASTPEFAASPPCS